jgi:hypothetical protein
VGAKVGREVGAGRHEVEPAGDVLPEGQSVHEIAPSSAEYVSAGQSVQAEDEVDPLSGLY